MRKVRDSRIKEDSHIEGLTQKGRLAHRGELGAVGRRVGSGVPSGQASSGQWAPSGWWSAGWAVGAPLPPSGASHSRLAVASGMPASARAVRPQSDGGTFATVTATNKENEGGLKGCRDLVDDQSRGGLQEEGAW